MGSRLEHKLFGLEHIPLNEKLEKKYLEQFKGMHVDTKRRVVEMIGTHNISGETEVVDVTDGFVSDEERKINGEMEVEGFYFVGFTDYDGEIPQYITLAIDCSEDNIILHPRSPETGKRKMIFVGIPGMQPKQKLPTKQLNSIQQKAKTKVRVFCNKGITYGSFNPRKPAVKYKMLKNYY